MSASPGQARGGKRFPIGVEPSGATWAVVRYAQDWTWNEADHRGARLTDLAFDESRRVLELVPRPASAATPAGPGAREVENEDGTRFRADPAADLVLRRRVCDAAFEPMPGFGGTGTATGRLCRPTGLAIGPRGYLYVADAGNHRVQVVRPEDGSVVAVLGASDAYGGPLAGDRGGAMGEPIDVAVDHETGHVFVLDRGVGAVHVFDVAFGYCATWTPLPVGAPRGYVPNLAAIAAPGRGRVLVLDLAWSRLLQFRDDGSPLPEVAVHAEPHSRFRGLHPGGRFATSGRAIVGPIDSGRFDCRWHEVRIAAELPRDTRIEVRTWASNDREDLQLARLAPAPDQLVPIASIDERADANAEYARLVLADWTAWEAWRRGPRTTEAPAPSDRGRYLWVTLDFHGDGTATPSLSSMRVLYERPPMLGWLPAVFGRRDEGHDRSGALFVERFLALFERLLNRVELRYESFSRLLDPESAPPEWLDWVASWLDMAFDPSWSTEKRRRLILEGLNLYRRRGTPDAIKRYIEIYTGRMPALIEGFRLRPPAATAAVGSDVLGTVVVAGSAGDQCEPQNSHARERDAEQDDDVVDAHRFVLFAYADPTADPEVTAGVVRHILDSEKPSHTDYELRLVYPGARAGLQSRVGLDLVVGGPEPPCAVLGDDPELGNVLGEESVLADGRFARAPRGAVLTDVGLTLDNRGIELT